MTNEWNARLLDTQRFTESSGHAKFHHGLHSLTRVKEVCDEQQLTAPETVCDWSLSGETRGSGPRQQSWMLLEASLTLPQRCQRCLEPMTVDISVNRWFRFVDDEATALTEDDECEEDLLVTSTELNTIELLEDELLLAMPLIVSHGNCQPPASAALVDDLPHPFAALAGLKLPKT
jgi:uncharacterized protein